MVCSNFHSTRVCKLCLFLFAQFIVPYHTACVDVKYEDGFVLSIYTPTVEDAVAHTMQQRSELDWLIYNDPLAYVGLVMSGKSKEYLKAVTR